MDKVNVAMHKITVQEVKDDRFSKTKIQCNKAVKHNHGIRETFSTGSQNQKPPHPN